ncbi:Hypothetical protein I595_1847 [Croceitalea dokdonensis DOKDO 023]|uniref:Uncharacterized protein n=1 Tax=Croceitalea dokdonensis DOKDO 023 TaxID=1300341 RepID=A0A0P7AK16_9FLAO|nr:Hypothetical protein I595_1847 [Croceitalea dokdonensis DOKDO 023]
MAAWPLPNMTNILSSVLWVRPSIFEKILMFRLYHQMDNLSAPS